MKLFIIIMGTVLLWAVLSYAVVESIYDDEPERSAVSTASELPAPLPALETGEGGHSPIYDALLDPELFPDKGIRRNLEYLLFEYPVELNASQAATLYRREETRDRGPIRGSMERALLRMVGKREAVKMLGDEKRRHHLASVCGEQEFLDMFGVPHPYAAEEKPPVFTHSLDLLHTRNRCELHCPEVR